MLQNVTDDIATTADVEALELALARVALAPDGNTSNERRVSGDV